MLETDEKRTGIVGVDLNTTKTSGDQIIVEHNISASSAVIDLMGEKTAMEGSISDFAAHQAALNVSEPVIKNNPDFGVYKLNDEDGLQHGTYFEATNSDSHKQARSLVSRTGMKDVAALINFKAAANLSGFGHVKNTTDSPKSIEVVYTMPSFEPDASTAMKLVIDGKRVNEFDGLEYKDDKGNVIPGFDITYSYQGHDGEYSTIDTLKQRDDFSWDKVTAVMVFGSLLPNSSYRIEFPFKVVKDDKHSANVLAKFSLNEYAFYDLTTNKHVNSQLNIRLSTPVFSLNDYANTKFAALAASDDEYQAAPKDIQDIMPTLDSVPYVVNNFGNSATLPADVEDQDEKVLWQGGHYFFGLEEIQEAVQEHGYSVDVNETAHKLMRAYAYSAADNKAIDNNPQFVPYVVLHQLLITKPFVLKAEKKEEWSHQNGIVKVSGLNSDNEEVAVDPEQTFIVDDSELNDAQPGDYQIIIGYYLNGSEAENMLITLPTSVKVVENKQTINVYYVDLVSANGKDKDQLQPSDGEILKDHTQTLNGVGDTEYKNKLWGAKQGYDFFQYDPAAEKGTYIGGQPAKDCFVYLVHKINKIDEQHKVTRTITLNMPAGAKQVIKQVGMIQRHGKEDKVTGEKSWGKWTKATLPAIVPPVVAGYTSKGVAAEPITLTTKNSAVNVDYHPKKVSTEIKFVDENGKKITTETLTGLTGELIDMTAVEKLDKFANEGYTIVKNSLLAGARFKADDSSYEIVLSNGKAETQPVYVYYIDVPFEQLPIVKPTSGKIITDQTQEFEVTEGKKYSNDLWDFESNGYTLFKADDGATKGQFFAGSQAQRYYVYLTHQVTPLTDEHRVKRTITVKMPDNTEQVVMQEAVASREGYHDEVTGEDVWHDWVDALLPAYKPTAIDGYDVKAVASEKVTPDSKDSHTTVSYVAQPAQATIKFVDQLGTVLSSKAFEGNTGEEFEFDPANQIAGLAADGYNLVENDLPADHCFAAGNKTYTIKFNKLVPVHPHSDAEEVEVKATKQPTDSSKENSEKKKGLFSSLKGLF